MLCSKTSSRGIHKGTQCLIWDRLALYKSFLLWLCIFVLKALSCSVPHVGCSQGAFKLAVSHMHAVNTSCCSLPFGCLGEIIGVSFLLTKLASHPLWFSQADRVPLIIPLFLSLRAKSPTKRGSALYPLLWQVYEKLRETLGLIHGRRASVLLADAQRGKEMVWAAVLWFGSAMITLMFFIGTELPGN